MHRFDYLTFGRFRGNGEDSCESLEVQGDPTSPS